LESWVAKEVSTIREKTDSASLADAYAGLVDRFEVITGILKPLKEEIELTKTVRIPEAFARDKVKTLTTESGYRVTVSMNVYAGFREGQREAAYEWLRNNGMGSIIIETVNSSSLSKLARETLEAGKELPDELFNVALVPGVSKTKVR
jgi:hypothetical protein